jgi:hypothetical protein
MIHLVACFFTVKHIGFKHTYDHLQNQLIVFLKTLLVLKVLTNEKRGGLKVVSFDALSCARRNFQTNWCRPHPVRGLKLLREPCLYHLQTIIVSK